jgi:hypothetical protein
LDEAQSLEILLLMIIDLLFQFQIYLHFDLSFTDL